MVTHSLLIEPFVLFSRDRIVEKVWVQEKDRVKELGWGTCLGDCVGQACAPELQAPACKCSVGLSGGLGE